ncbi:YbaB/EbfC family nucleoid-associated protein [Kitasatospora sp. NPDC018058]|uniref:YbaB/EbfC family nucleoid-associated protein n=1 Tax=Kitasatospora sp. NPDC018058 TaxID=3364025 RepID=UPI0037C16487
MTTPYDERIDQLMEEYRHHRQAADELQRRLREISATATAPRQTVKVTVGAQGELTAIDFPTGAYRRLAPAELAEAITTAADDARRQALALAGEAIAAHLPQEVSATDFLQGTADLVALLPEEPPVLDAVRAYVEGGRPAVRPGR